MFCCCCCFVLKAPAICFRFCDKSFSYFSYVDIPNKIMHLFEQFVEKNLVEEEILLFLSDNFFLCINLEKKLRTIFF